MQALERTEEIVLELEQQLKETPDDISLRIRLARAFDMDNKFTEAIRILKEALLKPEEIEQPDPALSFEEKIKTQQADQIALRIEMAGILRERSRYAMALRVFQQVEELKPENPVPCLIGQATLLAEMDKYDEAVEKLDAAYDWQQTDAMEK